MEDKKEIIKEQIEDLEWYIENYLGWEFGLVREWKEKLIKLKLELEELENGCK